MRVHMLRNKDWLSILCLLVLAFMGLAASLFVNGDLTAITQAQGQRQERVRGWLRLPEQIPSDYLAQRGLPTPAPPTVSARTGSPSSPIATPSPASSASARRPTPPPMDTTDQFYGYVRQQKAVLHRHAATQPDSPLWAGITFNRPLREDELNALLERHPFSYAYFEFVASNDIHGGYSRQVANSLSDAQARLAQSYAQAQIQGIVYVAGHGKVTDLIKLDAEDGLVLLVDLGPRDEINGRRAKGEAAPMTMPPNLYHLYRKFSSTLPVTPTPVLVPYPVLPSRP